MPEGQIKWPDEPTMGHFSCLINHRQPHLHGVFWFMDGLNLSIL
jgi:hypothetical protein